jgi:tyrosinase
MWIEMDKFIAMIPAKSKKIVARPSWQSTVVRRKSVDPALFLKPGTEESHHDDGDAEAYCDCGLPYRLLVPRGTRDGMPFILMAMLTSAQDDAIDPVPTCGSLSFCGRQDKKYLDTKEMGYPFHRPFDGPILKALAARTNVYMRRFSIRYVRDDRAQQNPTELPGAGAP